MATTTPPILTGLYDPPTPPGTYALPSGAAVASTAVSSTGAFRFETPEGLQEAFKIYEETGKLPNLEVGAYGASYHAKRGNIGIHIDDKGDKLVGDKSLKLTEMQLAAKE